MRACPETSTTCHVASDWPTLTAFDHSARSNQPFFVEAGSNHETLGKYLVRMGCLASTLLPKNLFDEIKFRERRALRANKPMKPKSFSEIFSVIYFWTASTTGFVHIDDIWLEHLEPQILVRLLRSTSTVPAAIPPRSDQPPHSPVRPIRV